MTNINHSMTIHALRIAEREAAEWHRLFEAERDREFGFHPQIVRTFAERAESWSRLAMGFRANILGVASLCI